ncbi:MAG: PaaI family thioesterase [Euryarchaeota archaeon]|nr:PaaI family thioesterase [Euryarchaeota archaeon]
MARGELELSPFDRLVGIRILEVAGGRARLAIDVGERFHNPAHVLHGGILSGLVDSAMAYAVSTQLDPDESCTNIDLTIRFVKATVAGAMVAEAKVVRAGRTVVVVECDVTDSEAELVARASSSFVRRRARGGAGWLGKPKERPA